jgi:uncharacterized protein
MYHPRIAEKTIIQASQQYPVVLVCGPRQVGKTTLLKHLAKNDRKYVSLDDPFIRAFAQNDPQLFLKQHKSPLLIDEIQYAPALFPFIKIAVDETGQKGAYWLTGSQQFQLTKGVSESLAGRIAIVNLLGFSRAELYKAPFNDSPFVAGQVEHSRIPAVQVDALYKEMFNGYFPAVVDESGFNRDLYYSSYLQTYLQRDVRDLTQVGDLSVFTTFIRACAARTGQLLNIHDIARDSAITDITARKWFSILEAGFIIYLLQPWHSNLTKRLIKTPKLYFFDTGLAAWLTGYSNPETLFSGALSGALFETLAVTELIKSWWFRGKTPPLYFYRDRDGVEIDVVFDQDGKLHPFEIKRSSSVSLDWPRSFIKIEKVHERANGDVLCLVDQPMIVNEFGDRVIPLSTIS